MRALHAENILPARIAVGPFPVAHQRNPARRVEDVAQPVVALIFNMPAAMVVGDVAICVM